MFSLLSSNCPAHWIKFDFRSFFVFYSWLRFELVIVGTRLLLLYLYKSQDHFPSKFWVSPCWEMGMLILSLFSYGHLEFHLFSGKCCIFLMWIALPWSTFQARWDLPDHTRMPSCLFWNPLQFYFGAIKFITLVCWYLSKLYKNMQILKISALPSLVATRMNRLWSDLSGQARISSGIPLESPRE